MFYGVLRNLTAKVNILPQSNIMIAPQFLLFNANMGWPSGQNCVSALCG